MLQRRPRLHHPQGAPPPGARRRHARRRVGADGHPGDRRHPGRADRRADQAAGRRERRRPARWPPTPAAPARRRRRRPAGPGRARRRPADPAPTEPPSEAAGRRRRASEPATEPTEPATAEAADGPATDDGDGRRRRRRPGRRRAADERGHDKKRKRQREHRVGPQGRDATRTTKDGKASRTALAPHGGNTNTGGTLERHGPDPHPAAAPRPARTRASSTRCPAPPTHHVGPQLRHPQVPRPGLPAADLPGRRHRVRRPLGVPRRDQRDRDRLRPQPERLDRRRPRLDAVHARDLEGVRRRRATRTARRTRTTRSTRSSPRARYLKAAGAPDDMRKAIFAYNHADWYVDSVMLRAKLIAGIPGDLVGSLTGLTEGRFPVAARARYADDSAERDANKRVKHGQNAANVIDSDDTAAASTSSPRRARRSSRSPTASSRRSARTARQPLRRPPGRLRQPLHLPRPRLGRQVRTRCRRTRTRPRDREVETGSRRPEADARRLRRHAGRRRRPRAARSDASGAAAQATPRARSSSSACSPTRPARTPASTAARSSSVRGRRRRRGEWETYKTYFAARLRPEREERRAEAAQEGLARHRQHRARPRRHPDQGRRRPHPLRDPPGRPRRPVDRPEADPRRLEAARVDRDLPRQGQATSCTATTDGYLDRPDPAAAEAAAREARALRQAHRDLPRRPQDIKTGQIDRRVLATLEYLAESGLRPTVSSLKSGHGYLHRVGQRLAPLVRQRGRHRAASTASRSSATRRRAASPSRPSAASCSSRAR